MQQRTSTELGNPLDSTQRRLEAVLDNATVSIFLMDERQHCIYMNRAAEQLTGFSFQELLERDRPLHDIIHHHYPDGRPFPLSECAIDRAFPEYNQVQGEEVFVHKDGSFYPVAFTASPIRDDASRTIGTIIEVRDIRAEKKAQEQQKLLLKELDHRVNNTLSTIQSIAWLTFKGAGEEALQRFNGRLGALSKVHNLLAERSWQGTSLDDVIRAGLGNVDESRVLANGPACNLDSKLAVGLSMVIHELAANAVAHGSLSNDTGKVSLSWEASGTGGKWLYLRWHEHGGPEISPPDQDGFGIRLIKRQAAMEFGGTATLDFPPEGLVCTMQLRPPELEATLRSPHQGEHRAG
ncbi:MAG TPA: HWE histidine kinase domain-containing protein [Devosia sp.]|nr:HWE histidine kinase domain-containing protein [Devosia sp.]